MKSTIIKEKLIFINGVTHKLTKELMNKYNLQNTEVSLNSDLSWDKSFENVMDILRKRRDLKLTETDYLFLSDNSYLTTTAEKTVIKANRKLLRDATENLITVEDVLSKIKDLGL